MLGLQECRLVPAHRPIKAMRCVPALFRLHPPEYFDLLGTRLFICQHEKTVLRIIQPINLKTGDVRGKEESWC